MADMNWVTDTVASRGDIEDIFENARTILAIYGVVTIEDFADLFDRPVDPWMKIKGWTSLVDARIECCPRGYRISLPMPKQIYVPNNEKEKNKMNKSVMCKKCLHESCTPGSGCTTCTECRGANKFVPKDEARFGSDDPRPASYHPTRYTRYENMSGNKIPDIKDVIFNPPATIVLWQDGTKTVVKAGDDDFDPEKGLAMAISKKALGNKGSYYNEFKKWVEPYRAKKAEEMLDRLRDVFGRINKIPPIRFSWPPCPAPKEEEKDEEKNKPAPDPEVRSCTMCKYAKVHMTMEPCCTCIYDGFMGKDKSKFELAE